MALYHQGEEGEHSSTATSVVTTTATVIFTTVNATVATFEDSSNVVRNFTAGTVATTAGNFKWQKGDTAAAADDISFTGFTGTITGTGAATVPTLTTMSAGQFDTGANIASVTVNDHTYTMTSVATFLYDSTTALGEVVKNGTFTGISTLSSGAAEVLLAGTKVAVAAKGGTIKTDSVSYADAYVGKDSAVNFSGVDGSLNVNLANGLGGDAEQARFSGITSVMGGTGKTTLMGAAAAESLVSGGGDSSLWGGAGKDTLVGGAGKDMFFIGSGDGSDVVTGFVGASSDDADTVYKTPWGDP